MLQQVGRESRKGYAEIFMIDASDRRGGSEQFGSARLDSVQLGAPQRRLATRYDGAAVTRLWWKQRDSRKRKKIHRYTCSSSPPPTFAISKSKRCWIHAKYRFRFHRLVQLTITMRLQFGFSHRRISPFPKRVLSVLR